MIDSVTVLFHAKKRIIPDYAGQEKESGNMDYIR